MVLHSPLGIISEYGQEWPLGTARYGIKKILHHHHQQKEMERKKNGSKIKNITLLQLGEL